MRRQRTRITAFKAALRRLALRQAALRTESPERNRYGWCARRRPHRDNRRGKIAAQISWLAAPSRLRLENQDRGFFLVIFWSCDIEAIEFGRPQRGAGAGRRGNLPNEFIVIRVLLLIDVHEPGFEPSASRGINTMVRSVIPQVVDSGDALKPRNLFSGLCVQDNQRRRIPNAVEQPMMVLIKR